MLDSKEVYIYMTNYFVYIMHIQIQIQKSANNIQSILFIPSITPATHSDFGTRRQPANSPTTKNLR